MAKLLSIREAAQQLSFPGGQNGLYRFLREHSGFINTTPPYSLVERGFFKVEDTGFNRGPVLVHTRSTKVTNTGLCYIAELMNKHSEEKRA